jgi:hypothetical protein
MGKVIASITTSVDGYVTGPDDGPDYGLGRGGERLHYWVMGGPWTYEGGHDFAMHGPDKEFYDELISTVASGVVGRGMYDAAGAWGGTNPFPGTLFVLTHRAADQRRAASGLSRTSTRHWPRRPRRPGTATSPSVAAPTSPARRWRRTRSTSWSSRRPR